MIFHDWRAFHEVWKAWDLQVQQGVGYKTIYCGRLDFEMQLPHQLANWGRIEGWNRSGNEVDLLDLVGQRTG